MARDGVGPLAGLRVLELATGVAGPYAGRLLAMLGAAVVKVEPEGGDPARRLSVDDQSRRGLSPAFVHLNAGKRLVRQDAVDVGVAVGWADLVLDSRVRRQVAGTDLDPAHVAARTGPGPVLASVTAWGFDADEPGDPDDEVRVQAASGALTGTPDEAGRPLRLPGWQSQYLAGTYAVASALALLGDGARHHVDVSWVGAVLSGVEAGLCAHLHAASADPDVRGSSDAEGAARQRGLQAQVFPAGAFRCADGFVVPGTVRPVDWELQCQVYGRPDLVADERFSWRGRWENRHALMAELQPWYDARTRAEIFAAGLESGWAVAMVLGAGDLPDDPHIVERGFLSEVTGGARGIVPGRPWRMQGLAEGEPVRLAEMGEDDEWFSGVVTTRRADGLAADDPPRPPPAGRLRILELTWAWAGPFVGRFLGPFGADVVKVETGRFPDGWRTRLRWRQAGVRIPDDVDPDAHTWDAAALFNALNRSKRSASVDLTHPEGRAVFVRLVRAADALVLNMNHRVLTDRGVEDEVLAAVDDGLVVVTMPALGATGPYRAMPGYGTLMEGMGGFAARFGQPDEGARVSATYYPDAVAGVHGVVAVLAALARRGRTGEGCVVDLSQQETMWLQLGEGIALASMEDREPRRVPAVPDEPVVSWVDAHEDGTLAGRRLVERLDHPVTGARDHLRVPVIVDGRPLDSPRPAPVFDQHTDEVLADWAGLDDEAIAALRAAGAVGTTPSGRRR